MRVRSVEPCSIFHSISESAQPGFKAVSADTGTDTETLEQDDPNIRAEQIKANESRMIESEEKSKEG